MILLFAENGSVDGAPNASDHTSEEIEFLNKHHGWQDWITESASTCNPF
jgi:hypothetical protein